MSVHELNLLRKEIEDAITENRGRLNLIERKLDSVVSDLQKLAGNIAAAEPKEAEAKTPAPDPEAGKVSGNGTAASSEAESEATSAPSGG